MNVGVGQSGLTCWFFSSLNMFLTSDNGLKILWQKLQEVYPKLKPREKNYFNSNINAPCPYKGALKKTSAIYFWKFLNQYMCAIGGPGRLIPKSGLNAYLTKNIKWRLGSTRESKGTTAGLPSKELPALLGHLGFHVGRDFRMLDFYRWQYKFKNDNWNTPILMYNNSTIRDLLLEKKGYELTGAIVYVSPQPNTGKLPHVWACSIRNNKGYICDSNYPAVQVECNWWSKEDLKEYFIKYVETSYRTGSTYMLFDVIMYTRKDFTNKIAPTCQRAYRPLTAVNKEKLEQLENWGPHAINFLKTGRIGTAHTLYSPRVIAESIRRNAAKPLITASMFNALVNSAKSFNNGLKNLKALSNAGYRYNINGSNVRNFRRKLLLKFPKPLPKYLYTSVLNKKLSKNNSIINLERIARNYVYTLNKNSPNYRNFISALNKRAALRSAKRLKTANNNS